jgi:large subunit ribosomal protein L17
MRHRSHSHQFGRKPDQRKALIRGLVEALVEHGRIKTTLPRAKEIRRHVEKAVTIGKAGTVHARRVLLARYPNKETVGTLIDDISKRFEKRPGGYTRIIKIGSRAGDQAEMAFIEFVDYKFEDKAPEAVKGEAGVKKTVRAKTRLATKKKKHVRKLQSTARKVARAQA